jgi:hypothetical protein
MNWHAIIALTLFVMMVLAFLAAVLTPFPATSTPMLFAMMVLAVTRVVLVLTLATSAATPVVTTGVVYIQHCHVMMVIHGR